MNELQINFPDFVFEKNNFDKKPRSQSFEITLIKNDESFPIWSGIKLKPRKEKFPDSSLIIEEINKLL